MKKVKIYTGYKEFYYDLLKDIDKAAKSVYLEFAIVDEDKISNNLKKKLVQKSLKGVDVRFIYDGFTTRLSKRFLNELEISGVKTFKFKSLHYKKFSFRANHRKLVLIDNKISYIGGMNIAERFLPRKDMHIRLEGILSKEIRDAFFQTLEIIQKKAYFTMHRFINQLKPQMNQRGVYRLFVGVPSIAHQFIRDEYINYIHRAKQYIYLTQAYFLPTPEIRYALKKAVRRGVDVRVIVPKEGNLRYLHYGSQYLFSRILRAGVKIFQDPSKKNALVHSKTMVCDDKEFTIGSANITNRSFSLSYELNVFSSDKKIAKQLHDIFMNNLRKCRQVTKEEWMHRSLRRRILEFWYARFRSLY